MDPVDREPCGNEQCDRCYPQPRFVLRQDSVRRVRYEVIVKAASREDAIAILERGEAQGAEPNSYHEHVLAVISEDPPQALTHVEAYPDRDHQRRFWLEDCCYHDLRDRSRMPDNLNEMIVALEAQPSPPEAELSQATVDALSDMDD